MWGIGLLSGIGAVAVRGEEHHRAGTRPSPSALRDVCWARQGRISVDVGSKLHDDVSGYTLFEVSESLRAHG